AHDGTDDQPLQSGCYGYVLLTAVIAVRVSRSRPCSADMPNRQALIAEGAACVRIVFGQSSAASGELNDPNRFGAVESHLGDSTFLYLIPVRGCTIQMARMAALPNVSAYAMVLVGRTHSP